MFSLAYALHLPDQEEEATIYKTCTTEEEAKAIYFDFIQSRFINDSPIDCTNWPVIKHTSEAGKFMILAGFTYPSQEDDDVIDFSFVQETLPQLTRQYNAGELSGRQYHAYKLFRDALIEWVESYYNKNTEFTAFHRIE